MRELFRAFPYEEWRVGQREIAERIFSNSLVGKTTLVEYPTGAGKTIAVLVGSLEAAKRLDKRVLYLARTKNEAQAPFREVRRLIRRGASIRMSFFRSKKEMCALRNIEKLDYEEFLNQCKFLRDNNLCVYYKNALELDYNKAHFIITHASNPLEFIEMCKLIKVCPYEVARILAKEADIIIGTYSYLFDHKTRENFLNPLGLSLNDLIVIIDEAHNLPNTLIDMYTLSVTEGLVKAAQKEVKEYFSGSDLIALGNMIKGFLAYFRDIKKVLMKDEKYEIVLPVDEFLAYVSKPDNLDELVGKLIAHKYAREGIIKSYLLSLSAFVNKVYEHKDGYVLYADYKEGILKLSCECVIPAYETHEIFENVTSSILMSGTLPPKDYLSLMLGLPEDNIDELRIYDETLFKNRRVIIVKGVTTRYKDRTERMFRKIGKYIDLIFQEAPSGVTMAVFPSYDVLKFVRPYIESKPLFIERQDTKIEELESKVEEFDKLLVLAVASGKVVEGVELTKEGKSLIKVVIIAGMPFPEPTLPIKYLQIYLSSKLKDKNKAWEIVFLVPTIIKIRQAAGRAIRSRHDKALIIILDERFLDKRVEKYCEDLYKSAFIANSPEELLKNLRAFYEKT